MTSRTRAGAEFLLVHGRRRFEDACGVRWHVGRAFVAGWSRLELGEVAVSLLTYRPVVDDVGLALSKFDAPDLA